MAQRDERLTVVSVARVLLWLVWAWVVIDLVLLFLAFLLRLFGASPDASFTEWVYRSTERAMAPFRGIFEPIVLTDQSVLDTSLLFAMIVYGIVALFLHAGLDWVSRWIARRRYELAVERARVSPQGGDTLTVNVATTGQAPGVAPTYRDAGSGPQQFTPPDQR